MSRPKDLSHFLATIEPAELGPGPRPGGQPQSLLEDQLKLVLEGSGFSQEHQELIRALVLLWHDHLGPAHVLAQNVEGPDGAFVHGLVHRREPDFGNAAYWFRRVGKHAAFGPIASEVTIVLRTASKPELAAKLVPGGSWDPFAFIDACAGASHDSESDQKLLRQIQKIEFSALLDKLQSP